MDVTRRDFVKTLLAAGAAGSLVDLWSTTVEAKGSTRVSEKIFSQTNGTHSWEREFVSVDGSPVLIPEERCRCRDIQISFDGDEEEPSQVAHFSVTRSLDARPLFKSIINTRASFRWVAPPGSDIVIRHGGLYVQNEEHHPFAGCMAFTELNYGN